MGALTSIRSSPLSNVSLLPYLLPIFRGCIPCYARSDTLSTSARSSEKSPSHYNIGHFSRSGRMRHRKPFTFTSKSIADLEKEVILLNSSYIYRAFSFPFLHLRVIFTTSSSENTRPRSSLLARSHRRHRDASLSSSRPVCPLMCSRSSITASHLADQIVQP